MHLGLELSFKLHLVVFGTFTFEILIIYRVLPFLSQMEETCYKLMMKNYEALDINFIGIFASHHLKHIFIQSK